MHASNKDNRLAVIAGLIKSDRSYTKSHNHYRISQKGEDHRKIIYDLKALTLSCGIAVTGVDINKKKHASFSRKDSTIPNTYIVYLGKGSAKFQHHLHIPRKRMNLLHKYTNQDCRPIRLIEHGLSSYRRIKASGQDFQLETRLMVSSCTSTSGRI